MYPPRAFTQLGEILFEVCLQPWLPKSAKVMWTENFDLKKVVKYMEFYTYNYLVKWQVKFVDNTHVLPLHLKQTFPLII